MFVKTLVGKKALRNYPVLILLLMNLAGLVKGQKEIVEIDYKNWRSVLEGEWMLVFYLHGNPSCTEFRRRWKIFADTVPENIQIGQVDVGNETSLCGRFSIRTVPTIYHINKAHFRKYNKEKTVSNLLKYVSAREWQAQIPSYGHFSPDSFTMGVIGKVYDIAKVVQQLYTWLSENLGLPSWLVIAGFLATTVTLSLMAGASTLLIMELLLLYKKDSKLLKERQFKEQQQQPEQHDQPSQTQLIVLY